MNEPIDRLAKPKQKFWQQYRRVILQFLGLVVVGIFCFWGCTQLLVYGFYCTRTIANEKLLRGNFGKGVNYGIRATYFAGSMCGIGQDLWLVRFYDGKEADRKPLHWQKSGAETQEQMHSFHTEIGFSFDWQTKNNKLIIGIWDGSTLPESSKWYDITLEYQKR